MTIDWRYRIGSWLGAALFALTLAACGGSGGGGGVPVPTPTSEQRVDLSGRVYQAAGSGKIYDNAADAIVKVFDASGTQLLAEGVTGNEGNFPALQVPAGKIVVRLSKSGYVDQVVPADLTDARGALDIQATLMPVGASIQAENFEAGGVFRGPQGMMVQVAPNSFVTADGHPVTGTVQIEITPYDLGTHPEVFPGSSLINRDNTQSMLASNGMGDFTFTQNGHKVQLATGKTARISTPLHSARTTEGTVLKPGDALSVWRLNEETGQWQEETDVQGRVVASAASPTGLAVEADVGHFSVSDYVPPGAAVRALVRRMKIVLYANTTVYGFSGTAWLNISFGPRNAHHGLAGASYSTLGMVSVLGTVPVNFERGEATVLLPITGIDGSVSVSLGDRWGRSAIAPYNSWEERFNMPETKIFLGQTPAVFVTPSYSTLVFTQDEIATGKSLQFSTSSRNLYSPRVQWLVNDVVGGNAEVGTISEDGRYQSPTGAALSRLTELNAYGVPSIIKITARSISNPAVYDTANLMLQNQSLTIVGQSHGAGSLLENTGAYIYTDHPRVYEEYQDAAGHHPVLAYAIHNQRSDKFSAFLGTAGHPVDDVQWKLLCDRTASASYGGYIPGPVTDFPDCAAQGFAGLGIDADGVLSVPDIPPALPRNASEMSGIYPFYALPRIWLEAMSPSTGTKAVFQLRVAPVDDPVGNAVRIVLPLAGGSSSPATGGFPGPVADGRLTVQRATTTVQSAETVLPVTTPVSWSLVCVKFNDIECDDSDWRPSLSVGGQLSGMSGRPVYQTLPPYLYAVAQWRNGETTQRLVQCISNGAWDERNRCDLDRWIIPQ